MFSPDTQIIFCHRVGGNEGLHKERKFIVFESCLKEAFSKCSSCSAEANVEVKDIVGTMVVIQCTCPFGHSRIWNSQPQHNSLPWGNLLIAAGILFSGDSPSKVLSLFHHVGIPSISLRTYHLMQRVYLIPSVLDVWSRQQNEVIQQVQDKRLVLGGDARCDSPGHSAKYGSYTLMELETNKILDVQLVQVTVNL